MKKRALPILLVVAMLITALAITAMADVDTTTPAYRNTVSEKASNELSAALASVPTDGSGKAVCPVCNKEVTWYSQGSISGSLNLQTYHWFLQGDMTNSAVMVMSAGKSACFYLNGHNVTSSTVVFETYGTLNVIGNGNETVSGSNYGNYSKIGATFDIMGGTVNLFGGIYTKNNANSGPVLGVRSAAATVNIYNGTTVTGGVNSGIGGNIGLYYAGSALNIYGGTISNGQAANGGNIGVTGGVSAVNISGGTIDNGQANYGGNIYGDSSVTFTVNSGSTIKDGKANQGNNKLGGNFYIENAFLVINGGEISGGSAVSGGNLYLSKYMGGIGNITTTAGTVSGGTATSGGNIYIAGGTAILEGLSISGGDATSQGGNIFSVGTLTLDSCSISSGTSKYQGGSIYANSGSTLTLTNTTVDGGQTTNSHGGSLGLEKATVEIINSTVKNGTAKNNGGCIYAFSGGTLNIDADSKIENGGAAVGGNLFVEGGCVVDLYGDIIGGTSTSTGGSIRLNAANTTMHIRNGASVSGGETKYHGGNIEVAGGPVLNVYPGALIEKGIAGGNGGNIYVENATLTVTGGTVTDGKAASGGNLYNANAGSVSLSNAQFINGNAGTGGNLALAAAVTATDCSFSGGTGTYGNFAYVGAPLTLNNCTVDENNAMVDNQVTINGGTLTFGTFGLRAGSSLILDGAAQVSGVDFQNANATLVVKTGFTGTASVDRFQNMPEAPVYGKALANTYTAEGDFNGRLILNAVGEKPWAFHDDGGLVVGKARTVENDGEKNVYIWHKNNEEAAKNYGDAIMMYPSNDDLPLVAGDYVVNVSGWNMKVTGPDTANVFFYDSANADFKTYGTVTVDGPEVKNDFAYEAPDGNTYYMVESEGKLSFHRLGIKVNGVSVRPSVAGIYYTSKWECDDLLKTKIHSFGVAVSLVHQPDDKFLDDEYCLYTQFGGGEFVSGETKTSVLITEIMKAGADNATRGTKPIHATAYVLLDNGNGITSVVDNGAVHYSLQDTMKLLDDNEALYNANKEAIDAFYTTWKSVMSTWGFERIGKSAEQTI